MLLITFLIVAIISLCAGKYYFSKGFRALSIISYFWMFIVSLMAVIIVDSNCKVIYESHYAEVTFMDAYIQKGNNIMPTNINIMVGSENGVYKETKKEILNQPVSLYERFTSPFLVFAKQGDVIREQTVYHVYVR